MSGHLRLVRNGSEWSKQGHCICFIDCDCTADDYEEINCDNCPDYEPDPRNKEACEAWDKVLNEMEERNDADSR